MASDRPSRLPGGVNAQLLTAIVVALGIGGGGGSLLAGGHDPGAMERLLAERSAAVAQTYATKLELSEMKTDLSLITQKLEQVSGQLDAVSAQLVELEKDLQTPPHRRR